MWLMTPFGFFSIVCARDGSGRPHPRLRMIRARKQTHLEDLQRRYPQLGKIEYTAKTDYPYRIFAPATVVASVVVGLADNIDYDNFKGAAGSTVPNDHAYIDFLHTVWGAGLRLTPGRKPQTGGFFDKPIPDEVVKRQAEERAEVDAYFAKLKANIKPRKPRKKKEVTKK